MPSLDPAQAALLGVDTSNNGSGSAGTSGPGGAASTGQSVTMTTGSFANILSSNMTTYVTTLNALTANFSVGGAAATGGSNSSLPSSPTTLSNATVIGGSPIPLKTINIRPAVPINLFSLLVAMSALAFAQ